MPGPVTRPRYVKQFQAVIDGGGIVRRVFVRALQGPFDRRVEGAVGANGGLDATQKRRQCGGGFFVG